MLEEIRKKHRRTLWTFSIRGGLAIIVAIFILARPLDSLAALALIVALWALASGLAEIVHALHIRSVFGSWWLWVLGGVISIAFGIAAVFDYPELSLAFVAAWLGLW